MKKKIAILSIILVFFVFLYFFVSNYSFNITSRVFQDSREQTFYSMEDLCGDKICSGNESFTNCPIDCRISKHNRSIKIQFPTYSVYFVTRYNSTGGVEYINGSGSENFENANRVRNFMAEKLDLVINGDIVGGRHVTNGNNYTSALLYKSALVTNSAYDSDLISNLSEEAFIHAYFPNKSIPVTAETRIFRRCTEDIPWTSNRVYMMNPSLGWAEGLANKVLATIESANVTYDGVFLDELQPTINTGYYGQRSRYWFYVRDEPSYVNSDGISINSSYEIHVDYNDNYGLKFDCESGSNNRLANKLNITLVKDSLNSSIIYEVLDHDNQTIRLKNNLTPGTPVLISYYALSGISPEVGNNWVANNTLFIQRVKEKLGNKLVLYNGIIPYGHHKDRDLPFWNYSDGGMTENFIFASWGEIDVAISTFNFNEWRENVETLKNRSENKIYLAQSGIRLANYSLVEEMRKIAMFVFASFLLGKGERAYFHFSSPGEPALAKFTYFDYWSVDLGRPLENYSLMNGSNRIYKREFEKALVLVNANNLTEYLQINSNRYSSFWNERGVFNNSKPSENLSLSGISAILLIKSQPYCGDRECNSGENCSNCPIDCGNCSSTNNPPSGGGTGGTQPDNTPSNERNYSRDRRYSSCVENWICGYWGPCVEGKQHEICLDSNSCGTNFSKPALRTRECGSNFEMNYSETFEKDSTKNFVDLSEDNLSLILTAISSMTIVLAALLLFLLIYYFIRISRAKSRMDNLINEINSNIENNTLVVIKYNLLKSEFSNFLKYASKKEKRKYFEKIEKIHDIILKKHYDYSD